VKLGHREDHLESIDVREQAKRRFTWIKQSISGKKNEIVVNLEMNEDPKAVTVQIVPLLMQQFDVKEPALLVPLVRLLSTVLTNSALCFSTCCDILERPGWFSAPDAISYRSKLALFRELTHLSVPKLSVVLNQIGALDDQFLSLFFVDLFSSLLTTEQRYRFVRSSPSLLSPSLKLLPHGQIDIYLLEGAKTIHRFGIGLLKLYKPRLKANQFASGEAFWNSLVSQCGTPTGVDINELVALALDTNKGFFQRKTVPSRDTILGIENRIRSENHFSSTSLQLPVPEELSRTNTVIGDGIFLQQSRLLDEESCAILNSFLPPGARMEGFELMFATYNDGWSFQGLYSQISHLAPCVLLIKAVESQALVGMYLSTPVSPPSFAITGDGQCFCFRLNGELASKYEWASPAERQRSSNSTSSTWDQFALCAPEYMAFGGSEKHCTNAIRLDNDLSICSTGHSDTYNNPCLVPEERGPHWRVMDVEVYCSKALVKKRGLQTSVAKK
jgi:hypothetical protein